MYYLKSEFLLLNKDDNLFSVWDKFLTLFNEKVGYRFDDVLKRNFFLNTIKEQFKSKSFEECIQILNNYVTIIYKIQ